MGIGIVSPGEMGAAVGAVLARSGYDAICMIEGRSEATRARASSAGLRDVESMDSLVSGASLILSILPPARALATATAVAESMRRTGARPVFVDCNAISPATMLNIERVIGAAGGRTVDASIIGGPPAGPGAGTRFYCSGPDAGVLDPLRRTGLDVRDLGPEIGRASALKMVYAASTKGTTALWTQLLVAAEALGIGDELAAEFAGDPVAARHLGAVAGMRGRAARWVGEMEEIAATFGAIGLSGAMLDGAAHTYDLVARASDLGEPREGSSGARELARAMLKSLAAESTSGED